MATYYGEQIIGPDTHANRPAVTDVAEGALFVCQDDDVIERNDGSSWEEWYDPEADQ